MLTEQLRTSDGHLAVMLPCIDCGSERLVRADAPSPRCRPCYWVLNGKKRRDPITNKRATRPRQSVTCVDCGVVRSVSPHTPPRQRCTPCASAINIARLAERNRGSHPSDATRAKLIESNRTRPRVYTDEWRAQRSAATKRLLASGKLSPRVGTGIRGKRADLGAAPFRSTWEANVARVFNACGVGWEFEPERFLLSSGSTYAPDFRLATGVYIEVKGYWRPEARVRFDAFCAEYPFVVRVIDQRVYRRMTARWSSRIPLWERT